MSESPRRILVVEDSATQAAALALLLENAGYQTRVARRAERALELLAEEHIDLVLSDVVMPGMDGYELCRRIRANDAWKDVPVVLLTSLTDPLAIVRGLASGAEHYVTKPYEPNALLARVSSVLERGHKASPDFHVTPFTVELLGTPFTIGATKEHILELLVSSYSDLVSTSEAVREAERRARFLADVTELLSTSLDVVQVLRDLARLLVPRIADVVAVDLLRTEGMSERVALVQAASGTTEMRGEAHAHQLSRTAKAVVESRAMQIVDGLDADDVLALVDDATLAHSLLEEGALTVAIVPLVGRERVLALLKCLAPTESALSAPETARLLEDVARRAALAVENALLYAEAQRATTARDDVLAVVSHDLRNPINTIQMSSSFLLDVHEEGGVAPKTLASQLNVIRRATHRANALIQDLLDVSRIDAGSLAVDAKPTNASSLIADATLELEPLVTGSGLTFAHEWVGKDVAVNADRGRIVQIFSNLVGNAVKFTGAGGTITITGRANGSGAVFEVKDTGSGISADHLPHLFDRFWKASQASRTGAGLGLSIVRGIVESHHGTIDVNSTPGQGTTFTFTLPAAL